MSQEETRFSLLPNEVIYYIFDFLTTVDILQAFTQLNCRYDNLVRSYIKKIDLTDNRQKNQQYLQWVCKTIQTLKIDRFYVHLLTNSYDHPNQEDTSHTDEKLSLRSTIGKIFSPLQKITSFSQSRRVQNIYTSVYQFPQLRSLYLIDVLHWYKIVSNLNLENLILQFNDGIHYYDMEGLISFSIISFSANAVLNKNCFHTNIIHLNVTISSFVYLVELSEHVINIERLSVTFSNHFCDYDSVENVQFNRFQTMINDFRGLRKLQYFALSTKESDDGKSNEYLPFDPIHVFLDRCCPNKTILKKVVLKMSFVIFSKDIWSTIVRYKNTYDYFNFYASFILEDKAMKNTIIPLIHDYFDFYIEDGDPLHPQARFIHIYSLPFAFDTLHGYISCSGLSSRCSYSTVRHLRFSQTRLFSSISFESLTKRMPYLVSVNYHVSFAHSHKLIAPELIIGQDIFNCVRSLRFISCCWCAECQCHDLLSLLLTRMPYLCSLTTSEDTFIHAQHPLTSIKHLDLQCPEFQSFDRLIECLSHLSRLQLKSTIPDIKKLSQLLGSLFLGIPSLEVVAFKNGAPAEDRKIAEKTLNRVQNMNSRLSSMKIGYQPGQIEFCLLNL